MRTFRRAPGRCAWRSLYLLSICSELNFQYSEGAAVLNQPVFSRSVRPFVCHLISATDELVGLSWDWIRISAREDIHKREFHEHSLSASHYLVKDLDKFLLAFSTFLDQCK